MSKESTLEPMFKVGDRLLRRRECDDEDEIIWVEFTVNETYAKLITECPEDYRLLDGSEIPLCIVTTKQQP